MLNRLKFTSARIVVLAFTLNGLDMILQPKRFSRTPAYGDLVRIFHAPVWGVVYLIVAAALASWSFRPTPAWWGVAVHTLAVALTLGWLGAFCVRWSTDDSTTMVNVSSWLMFSILLVKSALGGEDELEDSVR